MAVRKKSFFLFAGGIALTSFLIARTTSAVSLTPVIGYVMPSASVSPTVGFKVASHSYSLCYGGLLDFKMFRTLFLETGGLYAVRGFKQLGETSPLEVTFNAIEIPLLLRYFFMPTVSVGMGAYFSHGLGTYSLKTDAGTASADYSFTTYGADDYGLVASLALRFKLVPLTSLIVDGRYLYGLQNISHDPSVSTSLRDLQVLTGIQFGI